MVRGTNYRPSVRRAARPGRVHQASRHSLRRNGAVTNPPYGAQMTDVVLVRWPEETERLQRLRAAGAPRLLLVGEDLAAPEPVDPLEDWIRLPAAEDDLRVRVATLASRAGRSVVAPTVDDDGLLRFRGRWVTLSPVERAL